MRFLKTKILFIVLLLLQIGAYAQLKTVTGIVRDDTGKPLSKAVITPLGVKAGVITSSDGHFSISVPQSTTMLEISYEGFATKKVDITNLSNIDVTLAKEITQLDSVVVVAYGTQRAKDVTVAVTQIKGEAVKDLATQDVATMLQGRVAGVDVVAASGQPGAPAQITIRGVSSLNQPQPLYVIDGVIYNPSFNGSNNQTPYINPADIESMSILKDASATAIYGSSAAGGVILITTKRGKGETPTINFGARYSVTTPLLVPLLNKTQFINYEKDIDNPYYTNPVAQGYPAYYLDSLTPVDWEKELYRNGSEQNYNLSISGATSKVNYFLSGIYNNQQGVVLQNASSLAGARINTDVKVTNAIKISEELNVYSRNTIPVKTGVVSTPFLSQPVFTGPVYAGSGGTYGVYPFTYLGFNPVAQINSANFNFPELNFQGQVTLLAKLPVKYLTFKASYGYTYQSFQNNLIEQQLNTNGLPHKNPDGTTANYLYRDLGSYAQTLNSYGLAYDHSWGKHTINLYAGYDQYANIVENLGVSFTNVLGTTFTPILSSSSFIYTPTTSDDYDENGLVKSQYGRIHYNFNNKYDLEYNIRRDGNATTFGPYNQYGIFQSVSAAWNISDELFFKRIRHIINSLKLRGGYGEIGNSAIGGYSFIKSYNPAIGQTFTPGGNQQVAYTQQQIPNYQIAWESTHETNIGVDGEMLNGKIYFTVDWYEKNTYGLLYNVPIPLSSGAPPSGDPTTGSVQPPTFIDNIGTVQNKGVDIALGYKGQAGKLNYSIGATGSFNQNKVLNLNGSGLSSFTDGNNDYPYADGNSIWNGYNLTYTAPGLPFGQFYGLKSEGVIKTQAQLAQAQIAQPAAQLGDLMFYDKNHDGQITPADDTVIGNPYPKFTFGVNITASWKQWDIAMLWNGALGVQLYNGVTPYEFESENNSNVTSKVFEASEFKNLQTGVTNGITQYPSIGHYSPSGAFQQDPNSNYSQPSSYFVENGDYIKLKNLQIGYSISSKVLQRVRIKTLRIYLMANNLFAITKYTGVDPELGSQFSTLNLSPTGLVEGNANGSYNATNGGVTNKGIDGPAKYPNVRLYAAGLDLSF